MGLSNLTGLLKKAKQMQAQVEAAQKKMTSITVIGAAGGDLVKIHMNGAHQVLRVEIDPEIFKEKDQEMLEDLVAAAINDAVKKVEITMQTKIKEISQNIDLPEDLLDLVHEKSE